MEGDVGVQLAGAQQVVLNHRARQHCGPIRRQRLLHPTSRTGGGARSDQHTVKESALIPLMPLSVSNSHMWQF